MTLTDDFVLKCLFGYPVLFEDICAVYPVTVGEISEIGYSRFIALLNYILIEKPTEMKNQEMAEIVSSLSDFEYLLFMAGLDTKANNDIREAFRFFTHDEIHFSFSPPSIIFGPPEEEHVMNEKSFLEFKRLLRRMYFLDEEEEIIEKESDNPMVARIKQQMKKNREKLAKAKKVKKDDSGLAFSDLVASAAVAQIGLNILSIKDISYYAFHDQLRRLGWRDKFNINNSAALAGAKLDKKELKHWMRPINSKDN